MCESRVEAPETACDPDDDSQEDQRGRASEAPVEGQSGPGQHRHREHPTRAVSRKASKLPESRRRSSGARRWSPGRRTWSPSRWTGSPSPWTGSPIRSTAVPHETPSATKSPLLSARKLTLVKKSASGVPAASGPAARGPVDRHRGTPQPAPGRPRTRHPRDLDPTRPQGLYLPA